jgi:uncharacterized protein (DUF2062 family)
MSFKRRDKLEFLTRVSRVFWPKGGWARAVRYLSHRLQRIPDSPSRIARGISIGVFIAFTPFFGLHFVLSAALGYLLRGNVLAALLATFIGNPVTYVPMALVSLRAGYLVLGNAHALPHAPAAAEVGKSFFVALKDLAANLKAVVSGVPQDWSALLVFWETVFFPSLIGGALVGFCAGVAAYYVCRPMITMYQKRRLSKLKARILALGKKSKNAKSSSD